MKKHNELFEFAQVNSRKILVLCALFVGMSGILSATAEAKTSEKNYNLVDPQLQGVSVSGRITDQDGNVLPGVNVVEKGTSNGSITDIDGRYTLSLNSENPTLVFSYVGYITEEVEVGNKTSVDIVLTQDITALEEIVVIGYGTSKKSDLTGSVASADIEAFKESPNVNIMQSLQGSVPGVQIGQINQAGEEPNISIRGQNTLSGSTSPLIVVDGIIYRGRIGDLNPSDIKSVDILKDASSKAIYGAQSANGVMLITTKGGIKSSKKPTINYSASYSSQTPTVNTTLLGREAWMQKVKDTNYTTAYLAPEYTQPNPDWDYTQSELTPPNLDGIEEGTDYDWWDGATSPGSIMNHLLSISGGSESTTYYLSGGYTSQQGYILNDDYDRATIRLNFRTDVTKWLTIGANTFGSFTDQSGSYPNVGSIATTSPVLEPRDENGDLVINHFGDNVLNPFLNAEADDRDLGNNISMNLFGIVKIPGVKGLTYQLNYSNNLRWQNHDYSNPYGAGLTGLAYKYNQNVRDEMLDNIINYETAFGDHSLNATLVAGFNKVRYDETRAQGENIPNIKLSYNSLEQAIVQQISSGAWEESSIYQMARLNYNFRNKYMVTATLRRDGFSGFSENNKIAYFPSVGLGWVISEENFIDVPAINYLKVRASYGQNGNQTGRYTSLARISSEDGSKYVFGDGSSTAIGQSVASLANKDLGWELTYGLNVGLDLSLLNDRLRGNFEYYSTTTKDLLWNQVLPQATGFSTIRTNLGEIANDGYEFFIEGTPVKSQNFSWDISLTYSRNNNKIVTLLGEDNDEDGKEDDLVASGLFIGESIGAIYDYEIDGLWQLADEIPTGFTAGTYRIIDQNPGDVYEISAADDRIILGRTEAAYRFGIQNTLRYKSFSFRFFINSIQGGKDGYLGRNHHDGVSGTPGTFQNSNIYTHYDYWSPTNPDARFPQAWVPAQTRPVRYDSRSFIRLQDVSFSYDLPDATIEKLGIGGLKIFVSGKNLLTSTKWMGWDPETGQGIGNSDAFPVMKAYTIGLDISF